MKQRRRSRYGARYHGHNILISNLRPGDATYLFGSEFFHYRKCIRSHRNRGKGFVCEHVEGSGFGIRDRLLRVERVS